jgi:hypothetical protein
VDEQKTDFSEKQMKESSSQHQFQPLQNQIGGYNSTESPSINSNTSQIQQCKNIYNNNQIKIK